LRLSWSTKSVQRVRPYEKLAAIYDHVMQHVDYARWGRYILRLLELWQPDARRVLDIACGTGSLLQELSSRPLRLAGCDYSPPMVLRARQKPLLQRIPLFVADMTRLSLRRPVDVVLCLYDSLNYLMEPQQVARFFDNTAQLLHPGGLLIFDICTEHNSLEFFFNYYDHERADNFSYDRWSHYDRKNKIQYTEFKLRFKGDPVVYLEQHAQRIYSIRTVLELIGRSPFELLSAYHMFSLQPPTSRSNRVHFVLRRKEA